MSTSFFRSGMAPYRNSAQNSLSSNVNDSSIEVERDIWSSILRQVQQTANNKLPANKSILVLGDNDSGKTSLIAKMQGIDATCKGSGLEYHYLMVRDEYRDEQTQCGVWIIDGKYQWKSQLLRFALNADNFQDSTILLICSMTKPWNIMSSLEYWMDCLSEHVKSLNIDPKKFKEYQELNQKRFQDYISPGDEIEGLSTLRLSHDDSDPSNNIESIDHDQLPPDVLCHNLGLDIVIVITKTDYMSTLEKEYDFKEEHFDFIQQSVRKFCLKYGATLMYVSAKINKNCDLLYKYLIHRIYGLKFKTPALVVEKDAVFIPAGWDSEKKISILHDNIQTFSIDSPYNDVIMCPPFVNVGYNRFEIESVVFER
ncbi:Cytoplasmic dynein 1 light intermediate chain 1 [Sarcoptes scabiei]|uniref:Dynein light intermediate chain n=1 Tax=Sarcoptes scabiei TaxID=52283 RepID=A0A834R812_SARSC|nr:Cytoplasmic dynein 1 light intermediate chain 1 [Sarcoptes scabiei]